MMRVSRGREKRWRSLRSWLTLPVLVAATAWLSIEAAGDGVLPGDEAIAVGVQRADVPAAQYLAWIAYMIAGTPVVTVLATTIMFFLGRAGRHTEALFFFAIVIIRGTNWVLKSLAESPRPNETAVRVSEQAEGLGFPSGHVMSAVLLYGGIIYLSRYIVRPRTARYVLVAVAAFAIVVTGFGRIYTGAHWPSDVLGGYLWGTLALLVVLWAYRTQRLHRMQRVMIRVR